MDYLKRKTGSETRVETSAGCSASWHSTLDADLVKWLIELKYDATFEDEYEDFKKRYSEGYWG